MTAQWGGGLCLGVCVCLILPITLRACTPPLPQPGEVHLRHTEHMEGMADWISVSRVQWDGAKRQWVPTRSVCLNVVTLELAFSCEARRKDPRTNEPEGLEPYQLAQPFEGWVDKVDDPPALHWKVVDSGGAVVLDTMIPVAREEVWGWVGGWAVDMDTNVALLVAWRMAVGVNLTTQEVMWNTTVLSVEPGVPLSHDLKPPSSSLYHIDGSCLLYLPFPAGFCGMGQLVAIIGDTTMVVVLDEIATNVDVLRGPLSNGAVSCLVHINSHTVSVVHLFGDSAHVHSSSRTFTQRELRVLDDEDDSLGLGGILAIIAGSMAVLLVVSAIIIGIGRRRRHRRRLHVPQPPEPSGSHDPLPLDPPNLSEWNSRMDLLAEEGCK